MSKVSPFHATFMKPFVLPTTFFSPYGNASVCPVPHISVCQADQKRCAITVDAPTCTPSRMAVCAVGGCARTVS
jgi:hypothetical protein